MNRFRRGRGRCGSLLFKWHYKDNANCGSDETKQTIYYGEISRNPSSYQRDHRILKRI